MDSAESGTRTTAACLSSYVCSDVQSVHLCDLPKAQTSNTVAHGGEACASLICIRVHVLEGEGHEEHAAHAVAEERAHIGGAVVEVSRRVRPARREAAWHVEDTWQARGEGVAGNAWQSNWQRLTCCLR